MTKQKNVSQMIPEHRKGIDDSNGHEAVTVAARNSWALAASYGVDGVLGGEGELAPPEPRSQSTPLAPAELYSNNREFESPPTSGWVKRDWGSQTTE